MSDYEYFARCSKGFEPLLAAELKRFGIQRIRPLLGGVAFFGSLEQGLRACLWSRVASRVLLVLDRIAARDAQELYDGVRSVDWTAHCSRARTLAVSAHGTNDELRNTQFVAVKTKDAVCDQLRERLGSRPDVSQKKPDLLIDVSLHKEKATVSLDLSGEPLHRRGYRKAGEQSAAPLKENLAAGMLLAAGWDSIAKQGGAFVDPLCGSGTIAIEAAMIAADMAPGILRDYWGFAGWDGHDQGIWDALLDEADGRFEAGLARLPALAGSDADPRCVDLAKENAKRAGFEGRIGFEVGDVSELSPPAGAEGARGLVVTNPPYGMRLGNEAELPALYAALSSGLEALPPGWRLAVITPDESIDSALGLTPFEKKPLFNGKIETVLRIYEVQPPDRCTIEVAALPGGECRQVVVEEPNSAQFAARLRKVAKARRKWARGQGISCFRIYDADLPDYAVAIDEYQGAGSFEGVSYLVVSEYQAPKEIDEERARRRYRDVLAIAPAILGIDPGHVVSKVRRREKGGGQYRDAGGRALRMLTQENGYTFEVDLGGFLDTGLFLDHRITRSLVGAAAEGKRFLNLFAYTGTATVYAAGGGALETTTVDLSSTYLDWARRNLSLNGFAGGSHRFVRADAKRWMAEEAAAAQRYDLVFVDPPTFSNSKSMGEETWSVQRDHVDLLVAAYKLLEAGGQAFFSCNYRSFKPDTEALAKAGIELEDISASTIPEDFKRSPRIHYCYRFSKPRR